MTFISAPSPQPSPQPTPHQAPPPAGPQRPPGDLVSALWRDRSPLGRLGVLLGFGLLALLVMSALGNFRQPLATSTDVGAAAPGMVASVPAPLIPIQIESTMPVPISGVSESQEAVVEQSASSSNRGTVPPTNGREDSTLASWKVHLASILEEGRDEFEVLFGSIDWVKTIDHFGFNLATNTVELHMTTISDDASVARDVAWKAYSLLGVVWGPTSAIWERSGSLGPWVQIVISDVNYRCSNEVMLDISDFLLARSEWDAACRIS